VGKNVESKKSLCLLFFARKRGNSSFSEKFGVEFTPYILLLKTAITFNEIFLKLIIESKQNVYKTAVY